jgi:hypothetical protein
MPRRPTRPSVALVAGSAQRPILAVARSLSQMGVGVVVVGTRPDRMLALSRHVAGHVTAPDPVDEEEAYSAFIATTTRRTGARVVIPGDDAAMLACVRGRELVEREAVLAAPPTAALLDVRDKRLNLDTARTLGIPCPTGFELEDVDGVPALIDALGFPIVLKDPGPAAAGVRPRFAFRWLVANDEHELRRYLREYCTEGAFPLFQERVTGSVHNVCCFAVRGDLVAAHEYVSLRRIQGSGVYREVTAARADLTRYAELMLGALRWDGPAHLGFFVGGDGRVSYMETNGRFWGSVQGSVDAGWDFPRWTYEYFAEGRPPVPGPLRIGSRTRWHCGDLHALGVYLAGGPPPGPSTTGKLGAVLAYAAGFAPGVHSDTFRATDPLPAVVEHWQMAARGLARLRRRVRARAARRRRDRSGRSPRARPSGGVRRPRGRCRRSGRP